MLRIYPILILILLSSLTAKAQIEAAFPSSTVNYKVMQDDPKDLNKLWIHAQPFTIDIMGMNAVIGSGLEFTYFPIPKIELKGGIRGNFINAFDMQKTAAKNSAFITTQESKREEGRMVLTNSFSRFYNIEVGGMYALSDKIKDASSNVIISDVSTPGNNGVSEKILVNAKARQILGVRAGFSTMATSVSLQRAIKDQNISLTGSNGTVINNSGTISASGFRTSQNQNELFSSFSSSGFYLGGGFQHIKNITIKTDRQGILSNNSILTLYADFIFNPWTSLDNIMARNVGREGREEFDTNPVKLHNIGGRSGFEVRYNQASFISLGGELGYRPSIQGQGLYALIKLSVPTFSFGSSKQKVASNVGKNQSLTQ